jgi:hypothetical protein
LRFEKLYFLSAGFVSGDEDGVSAAGAGAEPLAALEEAAPVALASAFGASGAGVGAGVAVGAGVLGASAGGGVTTFVSSFLQAVRPSATRAATMSERVMLLSL